MQYNSNTELYTTSHTKGKWIWAQIFQRYQIKLILLALIFVNIVGVDSQLSHTAQQDPPQYYLFKTKDQIVSCKGPWLHNITKLMSQGSKYRFIQLIK